MADGSGQVSCVYTHVKESSFRLASLHKAPIVEKFQKLIPFLYVASESGFDIIFKHVYKPRGLVSGGSEPGGLTLVVQPLSVQP